MIQPTRRAYHPPWAFHPRLILLSSVAACLLAGCAQQASQAAGKRMIVLGVDGMDPAFLEAHWESLPNLNRLRQQGDFRRLGTTIPPQSPVAWSTVATGMDPGGHGIYDFIHRDPFTRMPLSSMAGTTEPARTLTIGPYILPLRGGSIRSNRLGRTFWQELSDRGVGATVIRMPANYPPVECEAESLAGMGTPDLTGSFGTFMFFTNDPAEKRTTVPAGKIVQVALKNDSAVLRIEGPPNPLRRGHSVTFVDVTVYADPTEKAARLDVDDRRIVLQQGEWSEWLRADFPMALGQSASGIFRFYLQQVHPYLRLYVSPVNIDPEKPALPISTPESFSRNLAGQVGPFYTQGIAEETAAWRAGLLNRQEFLTQSHRVLADSLRLFDYELARFKEGLLFYYFSSVDQNAHMLWGKYDNDLLEIYRAVDQAIGKAMAVPDTILLVLSDHGFARFDRAVHLNTLLMQEGFLKVDDPAKLGNEEGFAHVNWEQTEAYALGLNGVYLNLASREDGGIVPPIDKQDVLDRIAQRLLAYKDAKTGEKIVDQVYFPEREFKGGNLKYAPDLMVGFRRGYRASWQTALGAVPKVVLEDNLEAWIGDHCMAADQVPGVLLSNRGIRAKSPRLQDIAATVLGEFGIARLDGMIGETVF